MRKQVGDPASKRRRVMSTIGSNVCAAAATQSSSLQAGSNSTDPKGTANNPVTIGDSSDDDIGSATISMVINNNN